MKYCNFIGYDKWLDKFIEENEANIVQIRMMSSGDDLCVGKPPTYGVYIAENESDDEIKLSREVGARSNLGGGFQITAPIEFYVNKAPCYGNVIKRVHNAEQFHFFYPKIVGYSFSLKGADKIAYNKALETGKKLAEKMNARVIDKTSQDLSEYKDSDVLRLEDRLHNFRSRVMD